MRVLKWLLDTVHGVEDDTYADVETMFGRTLVYDTTDAAGDVVRVLDVAGTWQSGSYLGERWADLAFAYHRLFDDVIFGAGAPAVSRMLMLGGGALSYPKHVLVRHGNVLADVVEVDPAITDLARRYFHLNRLSVCQARRLRIVHEDGARFLAEAVEAGSTYDVIINDAFAAFDAPDELADEGAATRAHALLAPGGLYVANVVSALAGNEAATLANATRALEAAFGHVWVIPLGTDEPSVPDNNVVVATDAPYSFAGSLPSRELFG